MARTTSDNERYRLLGMLADHPADLLLTFVADLLKLLPIDAQL
jgi:hypothetical protein